MKNFYNLLTIIILSSLSFNAKAQGPAGNASGVVVDDSQKGLESATISLLSAKDSLVIKNTVSDKTGKFEINGITVGKFLLSVSAVGHELFYSKNFEISATISSFSVGTIVLLSKSKELKEVSVIGKKPFIEQKADRMVVNVDASPSSAGSSAMDILEKSPGVMVDKDGNISLKGKQGVNVMIDDKPTYLSATQLASYLKSLPASAIEQLEIMTNPSAKYDAAGNSGIINIKTKKNKVKGFNGNINAHAGCLPKTRRQPEYELPQWQI